MSDSFATCPKCGSLDATLDYENADCRVYHCPVCSFTFEQPTSGHLFRRACCYLPGLAGALGALASLVGGRKKQSPDE